MSVQISIYNSITNPNETNVIDFDIFLENIMHGQWQDKVLKLRTSNDQNEKANIKKSLPAVTISGKFSARKDDALIEHSNLICIDIDDIDPLETKSIVCADEHCYAAFTSCSGRGLAVIFKIEGKRHREAFQGISKYLLDQYSIVVDPTSINQSRLRFVSYDPDRFYNPRAKVFKNYIPKRETQKIKESRIIFVQNDFENIIAQLQRKHIDITYDYVNWYKVGFGIADKFGEDGRRYFHAISEVSNKYNANICDKQYDACLKAKGSGVTLGTFYFLAKSAGIETYSIETKEIIKIASAQKRSAGMDNAGIISNLKQHSEYDHALIDAVVPQVQNDTYQEDVAVIELVQNEIRQCWNIRKNIINRNLELETGQKFIKMESEHFNDIYIQIKKSIPTSSFDMIERIIISNDTPKYNPIMDFFKKYSHLKPEGTISELNKCINSEFGLDGETREEFMRKWFVGLISTIHGKHSPMMLVLCGKIQNTGKSEWFRRLLPDELQSYYAESDLDAGKDDDILMTQKIVIMQDDFSTNKREAAFLKQMLSKQTFSLREPYGRNNVDLVRLATLCGTSNEDGILNDPTGNRRIIPINVLSLDHDRYNAINKIDLLMEAYWLWHSGYKWELTKNDIKILNSSTSHFEAVLIEEELFFRYYRVPEKGEEGKYMTSSEIISEIDIKTKQKLNHIRLGMVLNKYNISKVSIRRNDSIQKGYFLTEVKFVDDEIIEKSKPSNSGNLFSPSDSVSDSDFGDFGNSQKDVNSCEDFDPNCPF